MTGKLMTFLVRVFGPPRVELTEAYADLPAGRPFDHSVYDQLVTQHVDSDGFVDYPGLRRNQAALDQYLDALGSVALDELGRDERLALLLNAYNAFTLRLILDHFPVKSIRKIPAAKRWKAKRWRLGQQLHSLDEIEHEMIRPNFREPRIHFALVCAAVGCPPLRAEAYTGERLEAQLQDQMRVAHASPRWIRYQRGRSTIALTPLYLWYAGDFEQVAGSVLAFVALHHDDLAADLAAGHRPSIQHLHYDWSLNRQRP
ncbi:MAG: DUF547 domain-containing protein [Myxococcota bacterium]